MNADEIFREFSLELYLAKEFLTNQKGQYRNPDADNYLPLTWKGYCEEIGVSRGVADNWLRNPPTPAGFAAAVWWLKRGKKAAAGKSKPAQKRRQI